MLAPADRLDTLPEGEPELTLGWGAAKWLMSTLRQPNGPNAGLPFRLTPRQIRFLLWWYALHPDGSWLYHHAVRRLAKGSGKSPSAAAFSLLELCGPVRLDRWDSSEPGGAVGKAVAMPLVQIAATAESQTENTQRMVRAFAPKGSKVVQRYGLEPGKQQYNKSPEGMLRVLTSSSHAAEGAEASYTVADEALALDTPLPSPTGWTCVGAVGVGDRLFGSDGPVTVTHVTAVFEGRPCYQVTFEDGTSLVADEGHLWETKVVQSRATPKVRTTREMVEDGRRFSVPKMTPFDGPDLELPLDPYVLGAWLGDGTSATPALTVGDEDLDFMLAQVRERGVPAAEPTRYGNRATTVSLRGNARGELFTKDGSSVRGALVKLGVLAARESYKQRATGGHKHVPAALLRASLRQRLDLLRGLMDTDGHIGANGSAVFVNANRRLVDDVLELVRSLGYTAAITQRVDHRWPGDPTIYKVHFRPDKDANPFLLPRKAEKVRAQSSRRHKTITSITPVESCPVKCIEVDAADHLFVASAGWTLTHNTEWWVPANGGPAFHATLLDNLTKSGSRMVETCNAYVPGLRSVAEASWDAWVAQEEGTFPSALRTLYDARVAAPDTDLADDASLTAALEWVYEDCWWQDIRPIKARIWSPNASEDDSRRKYLNQPTASAYAWVTPQQWSAMADPEHVVPEGADVVLFFDGSKSRDATALIGCEVDTGHVFTVGVWEPNPAHDSQDTVDAVEIDGTVAAAFEQYTVLAFFSDVREWESFALTEWPGRHGEDLLIWAQPAARPAQPIAWDMRGHGAEFAKAAEACHEEIETSGFTHDGDSRVARHVANAHRHPVKGMVSISKESPDSSRKIDAAVCVIGARMVRRMLLGSKEYQRRQRRATGRGRVIVLS